MADLFGPTSDEEEDLSGGGILRGGGAMVRMSIPSKFETHLDKCSDCNGNLHEDHKIKAKVHDLLETKDVTVTTYRCTSNFCKTVFGPNFKVVEGKKVNTACLDDLDNVLFVSNKRGFTLQSLKFLSLMAFRGPVSNQAMAWVYRKCNGEKQKNAKRFDRNVIFDFRILLGDALMYYAAMEQLAKINHHKKIVIGSELPGESLAVYDKFMHEKVFPPKRRSSVKEFVGDGHEKVQVRCSVQSKKNRVGKPRVNKKSKSAAFNNGWYMVVDPKSARIAAVSPMKDPENNKVVLNTLENVIPFYPKVDTFFYDRACKCASALKARANVKNNRKGMRKVKKSGTLKQIKHCIVDLFHAT